MISDWDEQEVMIGEQLAKTKKNSIHTNIVCLGCGAEFYSASPSFMTADPCLKCGERKLVKK